VVDRALVDGSDGLDCVASENLRSKSGLRNALEGLIVFVRNEVVKPNLHEKTDTFMPYFMTFFTGILFSNLLGLFPWGSSAPPVMSTSPPDSALCTLGLMIGMGVKVNGLGGFLH
jgi:F0F1-type ATP synthase membrane subunit a